jgi:hypothetical protein
MLGVGRGGESTRKTRGGADGGGFTWRSIRGGVGDDGFARRRGRRQRIYAEENPRMGAVAVDPRRVGDGGGFMRRTRGGGPATWLLQSGAHRSGLLWVGGDTSKMGEAGRKRVSCCLWLVSQFVKNREAQM